MLQFTPHSKQKPVWKCSSSSFLWRFWVPSPFRLKMLRCFKRMTCDLLSHAEKLKNFLVCLMKLLSVCFDPYKCTANWMRRKFVHKSNAILSLCRGSHFLNKSHASSFEPESDGRFIWMKWEEFSNRLKIACQNRTRESMAQHKTFIDCEF